MDSGRKWMLCSACGVYLFVSSLTMHNYECHPQMTSPIVSISKNESTCDLDKEDHTPEVTYNTMAALDNLEPIDSISPSAAPDA